MRRQDRSILIERLISGLGDSRRMRFQLIGEAFEGNFAVISGSKKLTGEIAKQKPRTGQTI
jgi:hypothetical protein